MAMTLEERLASAERRAASPTKLQLAFNALRTACDDVKEAKHIIATEYNVRISARTWHKAIEARTLVSPTPVL